jgi:hypothetical protein
MVIEIFGHGITIGTNTWRGARNPVRENIETSRLNDDDGNLARGYV